MSSRTKVDVRTDLDPRFALAETLAFGIGAQKSGTTWLGEYFSSHPDVHMSAMKEIHYWNVVREPHDQFPEKGRATNLNRANRLKTDGPVHRRVLRRLRKRRQIQALEFQAAAVNDTAAPYKSYADMLMLGYKKQPVAMEITPAYARLTRETFSEMASLHRNVRFIFLMRDPVSRLISGVRHHQRVQMGQDKVNSTTVESHLKRILSKNNHPIMERSRYDRTIRRLENAVSKDQIFYGFFETFFNQDEIDRLCAFLGIRPRKAETEKKVFFGVDRTGQLNPDLLKEAAQALKPVYEFTAQRFGKTPDAWNYAKGS